MRFWVTTLVVLTTTATSLAQGPPAKNPFEGDPEAILAGMGASLYFYLRFRRSR